MPGRGVKPLVSLRAHPQLAIASFSIVLISGIPFAWLKGAPRYEAEATIQVSPRYMRTLSDDQELEFQSNSQYRQFVEHQRQSLLRRDILQEALARIGTQRSLWVRPDEPERRAIERLRQLLQVSAVPDTYLLQLSVGSTKPEGLAEIVNAVAATFIERMKSEEIYGADDRTRNLRLRETELQRSINEKTEQRSAIARDLSLTNFSEGVTNPYDLIITGLRTRLSDARQRRVEAEGALTAFQGRGDTTLASRSVQESILNDPGLNGLKATLNSRRAALLSQKSGLRADHPGAIAADRELAEIEAELQRQNGRLDLGVRDNIRSRLQGTVEQAKVVERSLQTELVNLEEQATRFARLYQNAMSLTADITQFRDELNRVRERINFIGVERNSLGFMRLVLPALVPDQPMGPGRKKLLMAVILAACAGGVLVPILRDLLDRRIRTVNDAHRLMGIAPAGWQVERRGAASQIFAEEQLRRLSAALLRSRQRQQQQIFGFSGCKPGAGTTSLVLELASTLNALGYRVLAVEANGYSSDSRYEGARAGLLDLLRGEGRETDVVAPETATLPQRVAIGGQLGNAPNELGGRIDHAIPNPMPPRIPIERLDALTTLVDQWSREFDFILLDLPPLLVSADAELLVSTFGQVLLVVQAGVVTAGELQRARRLLETIDPDAVGLVVNRIEPFDGGGYLRDLMLETITARHAQEVFTLPHWRLALAALRLRQRKSPKPPTPGMTTNLLNAFDRICIINIPDRTDRRDAMSQELRRFGLEIDGDRVRLFAGIRPDGPADFPSTGARGCYLSHLEVLRQAHSDGVQRLLVLEDDVMFSQSLRETAGLSEALQSTDWDIAYPGHTAQPVNGPLRWIRSQQPLVCAHCYAIHSDGLPLVIAHLEACLQRPSGHPMGSPMHYDGALTLLRQARPDLITLLASRSLAGQRSSRSDIQGPSWLDRLPIRGSAPFLRQIRNSWRRATGAI